MAEQRGLLVVRRCGAANLILAAAVASIAGTRPSDVAVDDDGFIYVADWVNQRVQVFDAGWNFQASLRGQATVSPWAQEYLEANADELDARSRFNPYIEVDTDVPHEVSARVEAFFWDPIAVEIDPDGRLIVADSLRHRLQIYKRA